MSAPILLAAGSITDVAPGLILWTLITFVVLLLLLSRVAWKPILRMVEERETRIRESLEAAARQRDEATRMIREHQDALDGARKEAAALVRSAQAELERARGEHLARARKEAEGLIAAARKEIADEQKKAFAEVRTEAVDLAIQAASRLIELSMDEGKQRRLVEEYLAQLPSSRAAS